MKLIAKGIIFLPFIFLCFPFLSFGQIKIENSDIMISMQHKIRSDTLWLIVEIKNLTKESFVCFPNNDRFDLDLFPPTLNNDTAGYLMGVGLNQNQNPYYEPSANVYEIICIPPQEKLNLIRSHPLVQSKASLFYLRIDYAVSSKKIENITYRKYLSISDHLFLGPIFL